MLLVLYTAAFVLIVSALPTTTLVWLVSASLLALLLGFAWVTR